MLKIITAFDESGLIGNKGSLPWHNSSDLARFKQLTYGCNVVCGRKTADTLPPLPGRNVFVMSRSKVGPKLEDFDGWVIGGAEIYKLALPLAAELYITRIPGVHEGDTWFPDVNWADWELAEEDGMFQKWVRCV